MLAAWVFKGAFSRQTHTARQRNARPKPRTDQTRLADRHTTTLPRTPPAHAPKPPQTDAPNQSISTPPNSAGLKKLGLSQGTPCVPFFAHPQPGTLRYVGGWPLAGLVPGKSPPPEVLPTRRVRREPKGASGHHVVRRRPACATAPSDWLRRARSGLRSNSSRSSRWTRASLWGTSTRASRGCG